MLDIRAPQIPALALEHHQRVTEEVTEALATHYPLPRELMGPQTFARVVEHGAARARAHGLGSASALSLYLGLMLQLGSDFDRDPQLPWAAAALQDPEVPSPRVRLANACAFATDYIARVKGPRDEHLLAALRALEDDPSARPRPLHTPLRLEPDPIGWMRRIYPRKVAALQEQGTLSTLLADAEATASRHGLGPHGGAALMTVLALLLGTHFVSDPQLPWVAEALQSPSTREAAEQLHREAFAYLRRGLALAGRGEGGR